MTTKSNWRVVAEAVFAAKSVTGTVGSWRRRAAKALGYSGGIVGLSGAGGPPTGGSTHNWSGRIWSHITPRQALNSYDRRITLTAGNASGFKQSWAKRMGTTSSLPTGT